MIGDCGRLASSPPPTIALLARCSVHESVADQHPRRNQPEVIGRPIEFGVSVAIDLELLATVAAICDRDFGAIVV